MLAVHLSMKHALNCSIVSFISIRHNKIRDITSELLNLLDEVCHVSVEPALTPLAAISDVDARCDVAFFRV